MYELQQRIKLYATFLDLAGEIATISGTPTITIQHIKGTNLITDVNEEDMTLMNDSNFFYEFYIPLNGDKGNYQVIYRATYDNGVSVVGGDSFSVIDKGAFSSKKSGVINAKGTWSRGEKENIIIAINLLSEELKSVKDMTSEFDGMKVISELETIKSVTDNLKISIENNTVSPEKLSMSLSELSCKIEKTNDQYYNSQKQIEKSRIEILNTIKKSNESNSESLSKLKTIDEIKKKLSSIELLKKKVMELSEGIQRVEDNYVETQDMLLKIVPTEKIAEMLDDEN